MASGVPVPDRTASGRGASERPVTWYWTHNWGPLGMVDSCTVTTLAVTDGVVADVRCSTRRAALLVTLLLGIISIAAGASGVSPLTLAVLVGAGWVWLVGVNYLVARVRAESFFHGIGRDIADHESGAGA